MQRGFLSLLILSATLSAQHLQFDVISIRPITDSAARKMLKGDTASLQPQVTPGFIKLPFESLSSLIEKAFKVTDSRVAAPEWTKNSMWSVTATMPEGATDKDVPAMLQALLASRFGMTYHKETRAAEALVLTVARGGLKAPKALKKEPVQEGITSEKNREGGEHIEFSGTSADLANYLQKQIDMEVIDHTGLIGMYRWSWDYYMFGGFTDSQLRDPTPAGGYTHGMAAWHDEGLQKIGLHLALYSAKLDSIVIDRLNRTPTEN